jgi:hypothetical protein
MTTPLYLACLPRADVFLCTRQGLRSVHKIRIMPHGDRRPSVVLNHLDRGVAGYGAWPLVRRWALGFEKEGASSCKTCTSGS